jgi:hypothetical protein
MSRTTIQAVVSFCLCEEDNCHTQILWLEMAIHGTLIYSRISENT